MRIKDRRYSDSLILNSNPATLSAGPKTLMTTLCKSKTRAREVNILHISSGDLWAGAEVMIFNLLNKSKDDPSLNIMALSLNEGTLTDRLRHVGIETHVIPEAIYSFPLIFSKSLNISPLISFSSPPAQITGTR